MAMKVKGGEFYPVGNALTARQEQQYQQIWGSIKNYGFSSVEQFANKVRGYTEGENAAILAKKDPKLLAELKAMITTTQRLRSALG